MDTQPGNSQRGTIRVSDAERDQAVAELSEHYQAGRLTLEEFDERSSRALGAKTGTDLVALFTDLPRTAMPVPGIRPTAVTPADLDGRRVGRPPVARAIIACVIAAIIVGNVTTPGHHGLGWLVPVVILGLVFVRLAHRRSS